MDTSLLLCELHAHTTWSDGAFTLTELVDLYGRNGFDVLCVTDHALPDGALPRTPLRLERRTHGHYVKAVEREARRARDQYGLLVIPGLELTYDDPDPDEAAHALALGTSLLRPAGGRSRGRAVRGAPTRRRRRGGASARSRAGSEAAADDALVLAQPGSPHRAGRSVRALQPPPDLRLDRHGGPAGGRGRRLPSSHAPDDVEDPLALPKAGGRRRRLLALERQGVRRPLGTAGRTAPSGSRMIVHRSVTGPSPREYPAPEARKQRSETRCRRC